MVSMLWKGIKLERRLGSRWFGYIIATFSLLTGVVYLLLQFALAEFMNEPDFRRSCAVGFSGKVDTVSGSTCDGREGGCLVPFLVDERTGSRVVSDCWGLHLEEQTG